MSLIYFIFCAYGLTQLLCYGKIFDKIRPSFYMFTCPMCMGFWAGIFLFSINPLTELFSYEYNFVNALLLGWLSSGTSYVFVTLFGDDGINIGRNNDFEPNEDKDDE